MMEFKIPWWVPYALGFGVGVTFMMPVTAAVAWWVGRTTPAEKRALRRLTDD